MPGQIESVATPSRHAPVRRRWAAPLAFVVGAVLVLPFEWIAWALVAWVLDFPEGTDSQALFIGIWLVLVVVPLAVVWLVGGRLRRWAVAGAVVTTVLLLAIVGVTAARPVTDPTAARRLSAMAADSQLPSYYVGPSFKGWLLDSVGIDHGDDRGLDESDATFDAGDTLSLGYGTTCTSSTAGTCGEHYELYLHATTSSDLARRCLRRLPTTRGVTPVELEGYGVVIFVGPLAITFPDQPSDTLVTDTVRALRRVGSRSISGDLPAPSNQAAQVIAACGVRPMG